MIVIVFEFFSTIKHFIQQSGSHSWALFLQIKNRRTKVKINSSEFILWVKVEVQYPVLKFLFWLYLSTPSFFIYNMFMHLANGEHQENFNSKHNLCELRAVPTNSSPRSFDRIQVWQLSAQSVRLSGVIPDKRRVYMWMQWYCPYSLLYRMLLKFKWAIEMGNSPKSSTLKRCLEASETHADRDCIDVWSCFSKTISFVEFF